MPAILTESHSLTRTWSASLRENEMNEITEPAQRNRIRLILKIAETMQIIKNDLPACVDVIQGKNRYLGHSHQR